MNQKFFSQSTVLWNNLLSNILHFKTVIYLVSGLANKWRKHGPRWRLLVDFTWCQKFL